MSFHQNHSSQGHLSNKEPFIDWGEGVTFSGGWGQKYSWQSNRESEINNPWSRGGRQIIYFFKADEGFQNSVFIKNVLASGWGGGEGGFCLPSPPPLPTPPESRIP